jgi:hypothetical protein
VQLLPVLSRILGAVDVDKDRTDHNVETLASPATALDRSQKIRQQGLFCPELVQYAVDLRHGPLH